MDRGPTESVWGASALGSCTGGKALREQRMALLLHQEPCHISMVQGHQDCARPGGADSTVGAAAQEMLSHCTAKKGLLSLTEDAHGTDP